MSVVESELFHSSISSSRSGDQKGFRFHSLVACGYETLSVWVGKLTISRRYNLLPLLRSSPGGFTRSWPYRTYPCS